MWPGPFAARAQRTAGPWIRRPHGPDDGGVDVAAYLAELVDRVRRAAGAGLVGVYAGGSYALGAYAPGRSDLDVAVVVRDAASRALQDELVDTLRHEALPCPARRLQLVVYREAVGPQQT